MKSRSGIPTIFCGNRSSNKTLESFSVDLRLSAGLVKPPERCRDSLARFPVRSAAGGHASGCSPPFDNDSLNLNPSREPMCRTDTAAAGGPPLLPVQGRSGAGSDDPLMIAPRPLLPLSSSPIHLSHNRRFDQFDPQAIGRRQRAIGRRKSFFAWRNRFPLI